MKEVTYLWPLTKNGRICIFYYSKKTETRTGLCSPQQIEYIIDAHSAKYNLSHKTMNSAAKLGNINVLKYFFNKGKRMSYNQVCSYAAIGGHLDILKWARENGCLWNANTCTWATKYGHFNILKWARTNGCPWNKDTCGFAAKYGHFAMLKWARFSSRTPLS